VKIADSIGAMLMVDMAHIAGLVAAGVHPSPVLMRILSPPPLIKHCVDLVAGLVMAKEGTAKNLIHRHFPEFKGDPSNTSSLEKAVCLGEALSLPSRRNQEQVVRNAKALCEGMKKNGYRIVSGTTEKPSHACGCPASGTQRKEVQETLDHAGITCNKNSIPFDTQSPF